MKTILTTLVVVSLALTAGCGLFKKRTPISQNVSGAIAAGDHVLQQDNSLYDEYELDVDSGWTVHATMISPAFDTYLILIDPSGNRATYNDDDPTLGGNGTNSQITFTTTSAGTYKIYANAYQSGQTGAYQLAFQAGPPGAVPAAPVVAAPPAAPGAAPAPGAAADPIAPAPIAPAPAH
jgi:hypothetical protein